jgi:hypothetical protein
MAVQQGLDYPGEGMPEQLNSRTSSRRSVAVGLALLALAVAILGGGYLLAQRLRPAVWTEATSPRTAATAAPNAGATAQTQPVAPATSVVITQPADIARLSSPLEREVAQAYLRYWDVYAQAMETLSSAQLSEVTAGARLQEATDEVGDLRAGGTAAKIQVRHSFTVLGASASEATIRDEYIDSSYAVDPQTRQPVGTPGESDRSVVTMRLQRTGETWKVVGGKREPA